MTLERGYLSLDAGGSLNTTGIFELVGDLEVNQRMNIQPLFGNELGNINAITTSIPGWAGGNSLQSSRVRYFLDYGDGRHVFEINALGWEPNMGDEYLWGDPDASVDSLANARGEPPFEQLQTLMEYLQQGEYDSRGENAKLYFGKYYPDKADRPSWMDDSLPNTDFDDYKHVTVLSANANRNAENPESFDVSITMQETEDMYGASDIVTQALF
jgi:hypothetical protein